MPTLRQLIGLSNKFLFFCRFLFFRPMIRIFGAKEECPNVVAKKNPTKMRKNIEIRRNYDADPGCFINNPSIPLDA